MRVAEKFIIGILLGALIFYTHFYKLDSLPYRMWDETRLATNAYEMTQTGNLVVTTVDYKPDMWNTKPPLMIWAQALCIKILGLNELSIRLPAAMAALITILFVFFFVYRLTKNAWAGLLSAVVLCTAKGYIQDHATRFGEYDSMLTLFSTLSLLFFFLYTESVEKTRNKYLFLFFISFTLGVLTKGIAILLFGPALFLYLLFRKQLLSTLKNKTFYAGMAVFIIFGVGYYFLREYFNHGYLQAVSDNELGGRFNAVNETHGADFGYYINYIRSENFGAWYWALPTAFVLLFLNKDKKLLRLSLFCYVCAASLLLILSESKTKLFWYYIPAYPLLAIIIAVLMIQLAGIAQRIIPVLSEKAAIIILIIIFSIQPLSEVPNVIGRGEYPGEAEYYAPAHYLQTQVRSGSSELKNTIYIDHNFTTYSRLLYLYELNDRGMNIQVMRRDDLSKIKAGDKVLIRNDDDMQRAIESNYNFSLSQPNSDIRLYKLLSLKTTP